MRINEYEDLFKPGTLEHTEEVKVLFAKGNLIHIIAEGGDLETVKLLLDTGADVNAKGIDDNTLMHIAAEKGDLELAEFLLDNGADVNAKNIDDNTPLHIAVEKGNLEMVKFLLDNRADVNARDIVKDTPLHRAAEEGNLELVKFLLDYGVDVNAKGHRGSTLMHRAAEEGNLEMAKFLLDNGAGVNAKDIDGNTPMHIAAEKGNLELVKFLLDNGAGVNAKDIDGNTPMHIAAEKGNLELVKFLLDNGADVNARGRRGITLMHIAAEKGNLELVKFLLDNGADVNPKNVFGIGPFEIANKNGKIEVVNFLREKQNERPVQRKHRNHHTDLSNQTEIVANIAKQKGSLQNDEIEYTKIGVTSGTSKPTVQGIDNNGILLLLDVFIRKITGQKYISRVVQSISPLEAQGYALNIIEEFEKVVEQAALKSKISMHRLNIDFVEIQKEVRRKIMSGKFNEIPGVLSSYVEKACPDREAGKLSSKKFNKFMTECNKNLLNQSIQQVLHNGDGKLEASGTKKQQMSLEPQSYLSNASVQGHLTRDKVKLIS